MKKHWRNFFVLACFVLLSACGYTRFIRIPQKYPVRSAAPSIEKNIYMAGAAQLDITPPGGAAWLAGFNFNRRSYGVFDRIETRALALSDGSGKIYVFVTADLIGLFYRDVQRLREHINIPGAEIIVFSSHNHQGPDTMGLWGRGIRKKHVKIPLGSGRDENYIDWLIDRMAQAAVKAVETLEPVTIAQGSTNIADLCINKREQSFLDTELSVLVFSSILNDKRAVALVANYGCHPETVDNNNHLLTSDFVGAYRDIVDQHFKTTSFFVNGSLGAMVSPGYEWRHGSFRGRETFGKKFAQYVLGVEKNTQPVDCSRPVVFSKETIRIPLENKRFIVAGILGAIPLRGIIPSMEITTEVNVLRIGSVAIVTIPGEISPELGLEIKKMGGTGTQVWSLANDEIGYIIRSDKYYWNLYRYERGKSVGHEAWPIIRESVARQIKSTR